MSEMYIGMIVPFAGNFAPEGWLLCQGQELQIQQYQALFSIIGNYYGGNRTTTFKLPNLCGRALVGVGTAVSGTVYSLGKEAGNETVALNVNNLPPHNHPATFIGTSATGNISNGSISNGSCEVTVNIPPNAVNNTSGDNAPGEGKCLGTADFGGDSVNIYSTATPNITLGKQSVTATGTVSGTVSGDVSVTAAGTVVVGNTGSAAAFSIMQPVLPVNYIICCNGLYPQRP